MITEFELRDRIRTVLMNSLNQHHYSKMEDELAAVIKEIVAECVKALENNKYNLTIDSYCDAIEEIQEHFGVGEE